MSLEDRPWVCLGLGANLGQARQTLELALASLAQHPAIQVGPRSSFYRSAPVDASGPDFVNAVVLLQTTLGPEELLDELQAVELAHGRQRPYRNAPRTLDLDILLWGEAVMATPRLTVPHPRLHQRAFVLLPLLELLPTLAVPGLGALQAWLPGVAGQAVEKLTS